MLGEAVIVAEEGGPHLEDGFGVVGTTPELLASLHALLGYANHLGLYAEQTGPSGEALGNFPQAFTHLALISAAFNLDRALGGR